MVRHSSFSKLASFSVIALMLIGSFFVVIPSAGDGAEQTPPTVMKGEDFNHNVVLELFVTTWCGYCPSSEAAAAQLSGEYGEHFVFVTMVSDVNEKAQQRSDDYQVQAIPDGVFDGGYRREVGGQDGTDTYEGHIEDSGTRSGVPAVDLSVSAEDNGDGTMEVSYSATYDDFMPFFDAHLRVYIVEKESRYPDKDEHPIPYGFIDYAFDEDVQLPSQVEVTDSATWEWDNSDNATFENYVVIATLFDNTGGVEGYAVQSATTEKSNIQIEDFYWDPEFPDDPNADINFYGTVIGDVEKVELEYAICTDSACGANQYEEMFDDGLGGYTVTVGDYGDDAVDIIVTLVAYDAAGNSYESDTHEIYFDGHGGGGGSGHGDHEDWVESDTMFYSGVGLILLSVVFGVPLLARRKDDDDAVEDGEYVDAEDL